MDHLGIALLLAALAGASIPIGAALANIRHLGPNWLEDDLRHSVAAFGGGALFSAVAFVLIPEAAHRMPGAALVVLFLAGGFVFFLIDRALERRGGSGALFLAMMLDYVPEALALGALVVGRLDVAILTAALIALQNIPEGFSAYREMIGRNAHAAWRVFLLFLLMVPVGPAAAWVGLSVLSDAPLLLGGIMAFAAGGIVYLLFQDVAPAAKLTDHTVPALGAVTGFALGVAGHLMVSGVG